MQLLECWTMNFDYFLPLFAFVCVTFAALWLYSSLNLVGGWKGVVTFIFLLLGIRVDLLRREMEKNKKIHEEAVDWVEGEMERVYEGKRDPSGEVFMRYCKLFHLTARIERWRLQGFEEELKKLQARRPIAGLRMPDLVKRLDIDMAYNSNAIEGNPINLKETTLILAGYVSGKCKSLRHVHDIVGHHKAFEEVRSMFSKGSQLSLKNVLNLHAMVLYESKDGGILRKEGELVMIAGKKVMLSMPDEIEALLEKLLKWALDNNKKMHPLVLAVTFHSIFVRIHPFRDGNGRLARLLMNFILMQHGYPVIVVPVRRRELYMSAVSAWSNGNSEPLSSYMADCLDEAFNFYFGFLKIK
jgi:hypothetical protein